MIRILLLLVCLSITSIADDYADFYHADKIKRVSALENLKKNKDRFLTNLDELFTYILDKDKVSVELYQGLVFLEKGVEAKCQEILSNPKKVSEKVLFSMAAFVSDYSELDFDQMKKLINLNKKYPDVVCILVQIIGGVPSWGARQDL